ncbi:hypothetical protein MLD52_21730 [Puniceicoccaceae bacterium K14]|nr:hypothetical protein [Puniceicoccaceae bacterium K14]
MNTRIEVIKNRLATGVACARLKVAAFICPETRELVEQNEAKADALMVIQEELRLAAKKRDDDSNAIHLWMNEAFAFKMKYDQELEANKSLRRLLGYKRKRFSPTKSTKRH